MKTRASQSHHEGGKPMKKMEKLEVKLKSQSEYRDSTIKQKHNISIISTEIKKKTQRKRKTMAQGKTWTKLK